MLLDNMAFSDNFTTSLGHSYQFKIDGVGGPGDYGVFGHFETVMLSINFKWFAYGGGNAHTTIAKDDSTHIHDLEIQLSDVDGLYGIYLDEKSDAMIKNCVITDFYFGIYLSSSSSNTLTNNTAKDNTDSGIIWSCTKIG